MQSDFTTKTEVFIEKCNNTHNFKYDYSLVEYKSSKDKIKIICLIHGAFEQRASNHLSGIGCPKCSGKIKKDKEQFITESKEIHGDKYNYNLVEYKNCKTKVEIICPIHGGFEQTPDSHLRGAGCPHCGNNKPKNQEYVIQKCIETHGDKYDYTNLKYIDSKTPVEIICPLHGSFFQLPNTHTIQKCGCPKCGAKSRANKNKLNTRSFIKKAIKKHGGKYDYSLVEYIDHKTPIIIIDKIYGNFSQLPFYHLKNKGYDHKQDAHNVLTTYEFINSAQKVHGDKYDYSLVEYKSSKDKIQIICPTHGIFEQTPNAHLQGSGCLSCNIKHTKIEEKLKQYLISTNIKYKNQNRSIIPPKELDFYLPNHKIALEINGIYWHSELQGKDRNYHLNKSNLCKEKGIQLLQYTDYQIYHKFDIIKSQLKSILNISKRKIHGRKCEIKEIDTSTKSKFLNKYHLQGNDKASVKLGLFYKNKLVSVMTFCKRRVALGKKSSEEGEYELSRYCGNFNFYVIGGASKLLKYFERSYNPSKIITYADKSRSNGDLYFKLGFTHVHDSKPNYWYFKSNYLNDKIYHRYNFRKSELSNQLNKYNPQKSEWENMKENGWNRIWDCGNMVFEKNY